MSLLLLNKYFPRSVFYCLVEAENCLNKISGDSDGKMNSAQRAIGALRAKLEFDDVNDIISKGLHEYLDDLQLKINTISDCINDNFFQIKDNFISQNQMQE